MSIQAMVAVMNNGPQNSSERFVLMVLANYVDASGKCWPAYATIAKQTALSRRTVIRVVDSLVEQGYLRVQTRRPHGEPTSNYYWLNFAKLGITYVQDPDDPDISASDMVSPPVDNTRPGSDRMSPPSVTMTLPSDTMSLGGSDTMSLPSDTMSPDPLINHYSSDPSVNRQQKQQQRPARVNAIAAAAAPDDSPVVIVLQEYGIALNKTTAPILDMDADYVRAHLDHASRKNDAPGLAIRRIIDGDPVPRKPGEPVTQSIPAEWADVIKR